VAAGRVTACTQNAFRRRTFIAVRFLLLLTVAATIVVGCGGEGEASEPAAAPVESTTTVEPEPPVGNPDMSSPYPSLGCDVLPRCAPELAATMLEQCPESRLDAEGRRARERVQKLLARSQEIDLHNEQAYEAQEALMDAIDALQAECA
jgi:hypothetical protein